MLFYLLKSISLYLGEYSGILWVDAVPQSETRMGADYVKTDQPSRNRDLNGSVLVPFYLSIHPSCSLFFIWVHVLYV